MANCPNACSQPQIKDIGIIAAALPAISAEACNGCETCTGTCREAAITLAPNDPKPVIHADRCVACGQCIPVCPTGTLIEGPKGYRIQLGGKLGRHPQLAQELPGIYPDNTVLGIVADCIDLFKSRSRRGERFGELIEPGDLQNLAERYASFNLAL
jgi:anaerobic sulfite reductase subunit C